MKTNQDDSWKVPLGRGSNVMSIEVTIPNVKDAVNVFDRSNCFIDGLTVPAALQVCQKQKMGERMDG